MFRYGPTRMILRRVKMDWATADLDNNDEAEVYSTASQMIARMMLEELDNEVNIAYGVKVDNWDDVYQKTYPKIMNDIPMNIREKLQHEHLKKASELAFKAYVGN